MSGFYQLLLLALLGSMVALIGGVVFLFNKSLSKTLAVNSVPFAAGVLITVSVLGLLPEALEMAGEKVFLIVLSSFFGAYFFEKIFFGIHHHEDHQHGKDYKSSVPLVIFGDTIHNLIDGVAIAASYLVSPGLGLVTAISTLLHEVPHEIGDFGILLKAGWRRRNILIVNALSASATIVGASLVYFSSFGDELVGSLLALSAGVFLYLGASDFLPDVEYFSKSKVRAVIPLVIGVIAMVFTLMAVPHGHENEEESSNIFDSSQEK